jgi:cobalt/nickel transport system permease protein
MHLPDGFIDGKTAATSAALSALGVSLALGRVRQQLPPSRIPLLGLSAAFLFTAQMVNFPVVGGTSGHLVGGALVAALLGPSAAVVVVTTVLIVQCFLFADGGVLALGANVFNMALVDSVAGYGIYRAVSALLPGIRGRLTAIAFAGWCSTVLASLTCAGQLAWSGTVGWAAGFRAMAGVHMLIGIGEGLISALVLAGIAKARPEMIAPGDSEPVPGLLEFLGYGLLLAVGLAIFIAPFACTWPDGLESVVARLGLVHPQASSLLPVPAPDYRLPGIGSAFGATALAGTIGTLLAFGLALLLGRILSPGTDSAKRR